VAIFSDPDVVLVDEVLAVGDASFRRRALDSLRRLIADGKTVLFSYGRSLADLYLAEGLK